MRGIHWIVLLPVVLFPACGGDGPADSPKGTWEAMQSNLVGEDIEGMVSIMSPSLLEKTGESLQQMLSSPAASMMLEGSGTSADDFKGLTGKDLVVKFMKAQMEKEKKEKGEKYEKDREEMKNASFVKEEIDGDKAKVTFKVGEKERTIQMEKVDGKWYLASM